MERPGAATWPVKPRRVAVEPKGSERDTMELMGLSDIEHVAIEGMELRD
jgi:hypothetical protein